MISQDFFHCRLRKRKPREKSYWHIIVFDMCLLISCPAFLAPWCPASTYWWGSCLHGNTLQRLASQWSVFSQGAAGLAMAAVIDPAWDIKTQSPKDFLMDLGLFYQIQCFLVTCPGWSCLCLQEEMGRKVSCPVCFRCQNLFFCFTSSSPFHFLF